MPKEKTFKMTWETAKKRFELNTGKKKPSITVMGFIKKRKTGVGAKFGDVDSAVAKVEDALFDKKAGPLKKYQAAYQAAEKEARSYIADLDKLITVEFAKNAKKSDDGQAYITQLGILKKELMVILKEIEGDIKYRTLASKDIKAAVGVKGFFLQINPMLARANQWTSRLSARPDEAFYNKTVRDTVRNLSVACIGFVGASNKSKDSAHKKLGATLAKVTKPLGAWDKKPGVLSSADEVTKQVELIKAALLKVGAWNKVAEKQLNAG